MTDEAFMPNGALPRVAAVASGRVPFTLHVRWEQGGESMIDVSGLIGTFRLYAPLREDRALFRQVRVGEFGTDVVWSDAIDMAADTLWRLACEQSGTTRRAATPPRGPGVADAAGGGGAVPRFRQAGRQAGKS